jgi:hypothetical protein
MLAGTEGNLHDRGPNKSLTNMLDGVAHQTNSTSAVSAILEFAKALGL